MLILGLLAERQMKFMIARRSQAGMLEISPFSANSWRTGSLDKPLPLIKVSYSTVIPSLARMSLPGDILSALLHRTLSKRLNEILRERGYQHSRE